MSEKEAPLVVTTEGGLSVKFGGRLLYSERNPSRLPLRTISACSLGPMRLYLAFSPLLWYGVKELLERIEPGSAVLCVEADPDLAAFARRAAPPGLLDDSRLAFLETASPEAVVRKVREWGAFRACESLSLSGGQALNAELYGRMKTALAADLETRWRNRAALMVLGRLWANNIFANLAALPAMDPTPFPAFAGAAAVCGAGPSLEGSLPFLAANRDRIAIIACDTALGSLLAVGLEPDLVVCLEAQAHNLPDFVPLGERGIPLAADLSSHPATFRIVRGSKHLTLVRLTESRLLDRIGALMGDIGIPARSMPPLGSVGVHAVHVARSISTGPVLACGLDFSFEIGKTHSRGSPSLLSEERKLSRLTRWPGQYAISFRDRSGPAPCPILSDGRRLLSDPTLLSYAALLADLSESRGPKMYDIRGRGPSIGAKTISLDQAALQVGTAFAAGMERVSVKDESKGMLQDRSRTGKLGESVDRFLDAELERLVTLKRCLKGSSATGATGLGALVAECDYLYWSFPDADRAKSLPQDFLNRLLPEAEYWSDRISGLRTKG